MRKITKFYRDYVDKYNGALPKVFDDVPALNGVTFKELFYARYCMYELGTESDGWFFQELCNVANVQCPMFIKKIEWYNKNIDTLVEQLAQSDMQDSGTDENKTLRKFDNAVRGYNIENPIGSKIESGTGNTLAIDEETKKMIGNAAFSSNNDFEDNTTTIKHGKKQVNTALTVEHLNFFLNDLPNLYDELLDEFKTCFMLAY